LLFFRHLSRPPLYSKYSIEQLLKRRMVSSAMLRCEEILVFLRSVRRLLVAASVVPSSPILVTLMKEGLGFS
jgi:hypothetical protein